MTLPKNDGGLGLRKFGEVCHVAIIKRSWRIWNDHTSLWCGWMRQRYVAGRRLQDISKNIGKDSCMWAEIIDNADHISKWMRTYQNYIPQWIGMGSGFSFKNSWNTIRDKEEVDELWEGLWASRVSKHVITLYKAWWDKLSTQEVLVGRSVQESMDCYLYNNGWEIKNHIMFYCEYSWKVWDEVMDQTNNILSCTSYRFDDVIWKTCELIKRSPCWGLI